MSIVAAFTAGDSDNLMVGRNGVFYDRKGNDWDATIVKIVENPISISQAFWSPYKRVIRWVEETVAKKAAAADITSAESLSTATIPAAPAAPGAPAKPRIDVGTVAALGVAFAGITTTIGVLLQDFFGLGIWMPIGIAGTMLLISGPSMLIAWLKLRQRNLGPILDANGWAVNTRARINIPFGSTLTGVPKLPPGARRDLRDPYAETHLKRNWLMAALLVLAILFGMWYFGVIERYIPGLLPISSYTEKRQIARDLKTRCATSLSIIGRALNQYAQGHDGKYPPSLGDLMISQSLAARDFICPASNVVIPANLEQSTPADLAKWVNANTTYVYVAQGMPAGDPQRILIHERPGDHGDGAYVLLGDGRPEFQRTSAFQQSLERLKQLPQPPHSPAK
jgi:hypothetical protein